MCKGKEWMEVHEHRSKEKRGICRIRRGIRGLTKEIRQYVRTLEMAGLQEVGFKKGKLKQECRKITK